jgi:endo-1,4-beta-D-glucanase Y
MKLFCSVVGLCVVACSSSGVGSGDAAGPDAPAGLDATAPPPDATAAPVPDAAPDAARPAGDAAADAAVDAGRGDAAPGATPDVARDVAAAADAADARAGADAPGESGRPPDAVASGVRRPFPQQIQIEGIKPSHLSQAALNDAVAAYYRYWRSKHVKPSNGGTPGGGFFVDVTDRNLSPEWAKTTSEVHGYAMIAVALMAGLDPDARRTFDGLYNMFDKHRSRNNRANMSWIIYRSEDPDWNERSFTGGDMDIAYALLLAHHQWGSTGAVNYLAEARRTITSGIQADELSPRSRLRLGDWDQDTWNSRTSDWMPGHLRAFAAATGDTSWDAPIATIFSLTEALQTRYASFTGLVPDFVIGQVPRPAPSGYLDEGEGGYSWNASRFPLRMAVDHAHHGTAQTRTVLARITEWIERATGGEPRRIVAGYELDGTPQTTNTAMAFTAPFVAAASVDVAHQTFLNRGWDLLARTRGNHYDDSLDLLTLLLLSGNWWKPE